MPSPAERCSCGQPLHYSDPRLRRMVEAFVRDNGPTVVIATPLGSWRVPRHYIALHGLAARDVPALAHAYGWEQLPDD